MTAETIHITARNRPAFESLSMTEWTHSDKIDADNETLRAWVNKGYLLKRKPIGDYRALEYKRIVMVPVWPEVRVRKPPKAKAAAVTGTPILYGEFKVRHHYTTASRNDWIALEAAWAKVGSLAAMCGAKG